MSRFLRILLVLALALAFANPAFAQGTGVQDSDPTWQATYWNTRDLTGSIVLTEATASIDYDWGGGSPSGVNSDNFSARWTRVLDVAAGTYRFGVTSDDGIRLWVDSTLVIDKWNDHAAATYTGDVQLAAGHHLVKVEYYEHEGSAVARVAWPPALVVANAWLGEYWTNKDLGGSPAVRRSDASINFDWGSGSPDSAIPSDGFSARWTRTVTFGAAMTRFTACADDGLRLWVNNHLLIDKWQDQAIACYTGDMYVSGDVPIKLEYFENGGLAAVRLGWAGSTGSVPTPPTGSIIVDDAGSGFVKGGDASAWHTQPEGYNGRLTWTRNNDWARFNYNWGRWYPSLTAGKYEVYVFIPERYTTTSGARYWVSHRDGYTLKIIDQNSTGSQWVSLGTYWFRGNASDYVSLADVTYETYLSRLIAYDAVAFTPR